MRPLAFVLLLILVPGVAAQVPTVTSLGARIEGLALGSRNGITNLGARGDSLFVGPKLTLLPPSGAARFVDDPALAPNATASVYSIDVEGDVVWIGLGYSDASSDGNPQTAAGFAVSTDGGATWNARSPQIDTESATTVRYGVSTLPALPVVVPQQSPPFDVAYDPRRGEVWVAGWASGIRRSTNQGQTWQRVVLPPDTLTALDPCRSYDFPYAPERNPAEEARNFLGFAVLVDEAGTIWAGTAAGVNVSSDADVVTACNGTPLPSPERRWTRYGFDGTARNLPGDFVISIEEQPLPGRNPIWVAAWTAESNRGERNSISRLLRMPDETTPAPDDSVVVVEPKLLFDAGAQSQIYDFAFDGTRVYAAGNNGLWTSDDDGTTWTNTRLFLDAETRQPLPLSAAVGAFAVTTSPGSGSFATLWLGTGEGLLRSDDGGETWTLYRANVPTNPSTPSEAAPKVEVYAYPNPYSPQADGLVRFRYDLAQPASDVRLRLFDFEMRLVRDLDFGARPAGAVEEVWDGLADDGTRLANGVYFYVLDADDAQFTGKLLVME